MVERKWRVRLGAAAELDFANIIKWTTENFGQRQSRIYRDVLIQAIGDLGDGPDIAGSKARDEIMSGLRTLHIARHGRRGSHFLMYRVTPGMMTKSCESCMIEWISSVIFRLYPTRNRTLQIACGSRLDEPT